MSSLQEYKLEYTRSSQYQDRILDVNIAIASRSVHNASQNPRGIVKQDFLGMNEETKTPLLQQSVKVIEQPSQVFFALHIDSSTDEKKLKLMRTLQLWHSKCFQLFETNCLDEWFPKDYVWGENQSLLNKFDELCQEFFYRWQRVAFLIVAAEIGCQGTTVVAAHEMNSVHDDKNILPHCGRKGHTQGIVTSTMAKLPPSEPTEHNKGDNFQCERTVVLTSAMLGCSLKTHPAHMDVNGMNLWRGLRRWLIVEQANLDNVTQRVNYVLDFNGQKRAKLPAIGDGEDECSYDFRRVAEAIKKGDPHDSTGTLCIGLVAGNPPLSKRFYTSEATDQFLEVINDRPLQGQADSFDRTVVTVAGIPDFEICKDNTGDDVVFDSIVELEEQNLEEAPSKKVESSKKSDLFAREFVPLGKKKEVQSLHKDVNPIPFVLMEDYWTTEEPTETCNQLQMDLDEYRCNPYASKKCGDGSVKYFNLFKAINDYDMKLPKRPPGVASYGERKERVSVIMSFAIQSVKFAIILTSIILFLSAICAF